MKQSPQRIENRGSTQPFYSLKKALLHRHANSLGLSLTSHKCTCCAKNLEKVPLRCDFQISNLYEVGAGLPLFLIHFKYLAIAMFFLCLIFSPAMMILNFSSNGCSMLLKNRSLECSSSIFVRMSTVNGLDNASLIILQSYLLAAAALVLVIIMHFIRKSCRLIVSDVEILNYFPNQFAVSLTFQTNVKEQAIIKSLKKWWEKQIKQNSSLLKDTFPQIFSVKMQNKKNIDEQISEISQKGMLINSIEEQFDKMFDSIYTCKNYQHFEEIKQRIEELTASLKDSDEHTSRSVEMIKEIGVLKNKINFISPTNKCFVIFKQRKYASYFVKKNSPSSLVEKIFCYEKFRQFQCCNESVDVRSAPYPEEISWENQHWKGREKMLRHFSLFLVVVLAFGLGVGVIALVFWWWKQNIQGSNLLIESYTSIVFALTAFILSLVMTWLVDLMVDKHNRSQALSGKESLKIQLKVLLSPGNFGVACLTAYLFFMDFNLLWEPNGIIQTLSYLFMGSICLPYPISYFSKSSLISLYYRLTLNGKEQICQADANQRLTKPKQNISSDYAYALSMFYFSCFFSSLIPIAFTCCLVNLLINYWLQKLNMAKYYREPSSFGDSLNAQIVVMMEKAIIFLSAGNLAMQLIANSIISNGIDLPSFTLTAIILGLSCCSLIFPADCIVQLFVCHSNIQQEENKDNEQFNTLHEYSALKKHFQCLYEQTDPIQNYLRDERNDKYSQMLKITQQLNTMSKTLTVSLKQRLLNQPTTLNQAGHEEKSLHGQESQINDGYFEYENKVEMKKPVLKIKVPAIFKAQKALPNKNGFKQQFIELKDAGPGLLNLNHIFGDNEVGKKTIKSNIKKGIHKLDQNQNN